MFSKLSKLEAKLGTIDLDDLQTLDVDSPDHVYFQMLSNFEKKYGDSYRISDWLGDVREKLVLVLLLKIESLANRLDTANNILLLTYVCDTVRICLREPLELATVQVEHVLSSIVRILNAQASLTLSISALRLLLNLLNRQPSRMQVFISGRIQGIQCLNGLIRFGHKNDTQTLTDNSDAKSSDQNIVVSLANNTNSVSESDRHEMHVKVIHHAVRIVFMISCESGRLLSNLRGFRTLTVACAKRLFFCLSNHYPVPQYSTTPQDTTVSTESDAKHETSETGSEKYTLANFPYSEVNAQLYTDLVKVLYALDNLSDIASSAYFTCTSHDSAYYNANIRLNYGHNQDCDNTLETKEELSINIFAQKWCRFLSLDETQAAAYGVAEPVTGTLSSQFRTNKNTKDDHNHIPLYTVSSKFDSKNIDDHNQDTFSDTLNDDTNINVRLLDDDERAINAASLEEIRFTLVNQYLSSKNNMKNVKNSNINNIINNNNVNSNAQSKEEVSSTRTLVRVVQQQVAANKSETADGEQSVLILSDEKSVCFKSNKINTNNSDNNTHNSSNFSVHECEMWSAMSLVALVTEVVLTLGPCHLQPPLLFADQQPLLLKNNNNSNAKENDSSTYTSVSQNTMNSSSHSNKHCTYRQVYQLIVGRLSDVEEITLQLALILPETVFPSMMMHLLDTLEGSVFNNNNTSSGNTSIRIEGVSRGVTETQLSSEAKDPNTNTGNNADYKADAKPPATSRDIPKAVSTFEDAFTVFDAIFDDDASNKNTSNNKNKFEVTQTRHLLHRLCRGRVAWLPDALLRILYRVLLKTRPRAVSSNNNNNTNLVSAVSLIPCLMLLSKLSLVLSHMTTFVKKKLTTQRWAVATQQQLDIVRFAFKHRVFPTLFEPSEHTLLSNNNLSNNNNNNTNNNNNLFSLSQSLKRINNSANNSTNSVNNGNSNINNNNAADPLAPWDCPCDTLRHEMISRMTSVSCEGHVSRLMSEILFLLCEEDKDEFKVRTGLGNSIHLMQLKGLL